MSDTTAKSEPKPESKVSNITTNVIISVIGGIIMLGLVYITTQLGKIDRLEQTINELELKATLGALQDSAAVDSFRIKMILVNMKGKGDIDDATMATILNR